MSSELIPLADAAAMLGISKEKLNEMRSNNEIFGLRDGTTWRFKQSELERVADELGVTLGGGKAQPAGDLLESDDEFSLSDSSLNAAAGSGADLISDLDTPVESGSDEDEALLEASDDMLLSDSSNSGASISLSDSGVLENSGILENSGELKLDDELALADDDDGELNFGESDLSLAAQLQDESALDDQPQDKDPSASDTNKASSGINSNKKNKPNVADDLALMDEDLFEEDELSLQDSVGMDDGSDLSSDFADSSDVIVDDSDSDAPVGDDLILDEEDLIVSEEASGDDDFALSDSDMLSLDDDGSADDFDLEPVFEAGDDQSSSSQVIALEDSDLMDDSNATMMLDNQSGDLMAADEYANEDAMPLESFDGAPVPFDASQAGLVPVPAESPYSIWQILALGSTFLVTSILAVLCLNLAQNMWQPADSSFTGTFADWIVDTLQFNK